MNLTAPIADVQGSLATRLIAINRVGVRSIKHPVWVRLANGTTQRTIAQLSMYVDLAAHQRGTHMSRFVEILNQGEIILSTAELPHLLATMTSRLGAKTGWFQANFTLFLEKEAPVSKVKSIMDYEVALWGRINEDVTTVGTTVIVPVTALCPCSKEISDYGAHNQRSHITVDAESLGALPIEQLIHLAEKEGSCELYGILKRPDEKYVTERAYDHPKFVEDLVRDVAEKLNQLTTVRAYRVSAENFESIHNHSAFAEIEHRKY